MPTDPKLSPQLDSGLNSLVLLGRLSGVSSDPQQLRHRFCGSGELFDESLILRAAKFLGLRAKALHSSWDRLARSPLPAIAQFQNGRFVVIGRVVGDDVLIQDPGERQPTKLCREQFSELWTGRLILATKRSALQGTSGKFDFGWFIPSTAILVRPAE